MYEIFLLAWVAMMGLTMPRLAVWRTETVLGEKRYCLKPLAAMVVFAPIVWIVAKHGWGSDKWNYAAGFMSLPGTLDGIWQQFLQTESDAGFVLVMGLIKLVIGNNYRTYFLVLGAIQCLCILSVFRKYSENYFISVFLFLASTTYTWMGNGIRQFTAVTLIFAATPLMVKKKYFPLLLVILLASTIHQSALIMIPLVLIASGDAWNKKTVYYMAAILLAVVFIDRFTDVLELVMEDTNYANAVSGWRAWGDDGANPFRALISLVPVVIAYLGRDKIRKAKDPVVNLCTNMAIMSAGITIISVFTSGIMIGRLPIYVSMYSYILLPWLIKNVFEGKNSKIMNGLMILCYLLYGYYQLYIAWGGGMT